MLREEEAFARAYDADGAFVSARRRARKFARHEERLFRNVVDARFRLRFVVLGEIDGLIEDVRNSLTVLRGVRRARELVAVRFRPLGACRDAAIAKGLRKLLLRRDGRIGGVWLVDEFFHVERRGISVGRSVGERAFLTACRRVSDVEALNAPLRSVAAERVRAV